MDVIRIGAVLINTAHLIKIEAARNSEGNITGVNVFYSGGKVDFFADPRAWEGLLQHFGGDQNAMVSSTTFPERR